MRQRVLEEQADVWRTRWSDTMMVMVLGLTVNERGGKALE